MRRNFRTFKLAYVKSTRQELITMKELKNLYKDLANNDLYNLIDNIYKKIKNEIWEDKVPKDEQWERRGLC